MFRSVSFDSGLSLGTVKKKKVTRLVIVRRIQVDEEKEEDVQRDFVARCRVANVNVKQCLEDGHGDTQFVYIYIYIYIFTSVCPPLFGVYGSREWRVR